MTSNEPSPRMVDTDFEQNMLCYATYKVNEFTKKIRRNKLTKVKVMQRKAITYVRRTTKKGRTKKR